MTTNLIKLTFKNDIEGVKQFIAKGKDINMQDKDGNFTTMNLYDTKKLARRSAKWDTTQTAKEEKTSIASRILKDFGFLG